VGALVDERATVTARATGDALLAAVGGGLAVPAAADQRTREIASSLVSHHRLV
jgi:hypothetical protein